MLTEKQPQDPPAVSSKSKDTQTVLASSVRNALSPQKENVKGDVYMATVKSYNSLPDIRMATAKGGFTIRNDIHMETISGTMTVKQGGLQLWERELIEAPEVKRKATVAQLCKFCIALM